MRREWRDTIRAFVKYLFPIAVAFSSPVPAQDRFDKLLSQDELAGLLRRESDANALNIFVTPGLRRGPWYDSRFDLSGVRKTKIGDWWAWHSGREDMRDIAGLAADNQRLISKYLPKLAQSVGAKTDFKGVQVSASAQMYAHLCRIAFDIPFDRSQIDLIWATQAHPSPTVTASCLDFGLLLAGHRIRLIDRDGVLTGRKEP